MRKVDALVIEFPDIYKCIGETDIDKTYEMPKSFVSYRKPRRLSEEQREVARKRIVKIKKFKIVGKDIDIRRSNDYNGIRANGGLKWTILRLKKHQINGDYL